MQNFCRSLIGHLKVSINFIIKFQESLLGFIIETIDANFNCLCFVTNDAVSTDDVDQTTSGDNILDTTIVEGLADDVTPVNQTLTEVRSNHVKVSCHILQDTLLSLY